MATLQIGREEKVIKKIIIKIVIKESKEIIKNTKN